jgi:glycosyltransferase involved in cell wall biosynthesis
MPGPKVSIIVPVYNGANYMREAIDSALAQTWEETEVVVVNDGSRDDGATEAIARSYGDRISYIAKPNGGVASALNAGVAAMTGDIFCWCSHDDMHHPEKTARQVAEWDRLSRPECVLYTDYRLVNASGKPLTDVRMDHALLIEKPIYALLRGAVHGCSVFIPRRLFDVVGNFDEGLPTTQDYDLWFRMARYATFVHMPDVLVLSRWHDEQGSKRADHRTEAAGLWRNMMDGIPPDEQTALEGSKYRFYMSTARFLRENGLDVPAAYAEGRAEEAIARTLVSVIIPVYGRVEKALSALDSVLAQDHREIEAIVVDDGSLPAQAAILMAEIATRPPARLLRQENKGPAAARNAGWAAARGDYVAFLDSDDLFMPGKIAIQLRAMEESGSVLCHTSYWRWQTGECRPELIHSGRLGGASAFPDIVAGCAVATPTVMLRRTLMDAGYSFREDFRIGEDVSLWIRLTARFGLLGLDQPLALVRSGADSAANNLGKQSRGLANIVAAVRADSEVAVTARLQLARLEAIAMAAQNAEKACASLV